MLEVEIGYRWNIKTMKYHHEFHNEFLCPRNTAVVLKTIVQYNSEVYFAGSCQVHYLSQST